MGYNTESKNPSGLFIAMAGAEYSSLYQDAEKHLSKYERYLRNAIKAQENKRIQCKWSRLNGNGLKLYPEMLYQVRPETIITLKNLDYGWIKLQTDEDISDLDTESIVGAAIYSGKGKNRKEISIDEYKQENGAYLLKLSELPTEPEITFQGYLFSWEEQNQISKISQFSLDGEPIDVILGEDSTSFTVEKVISKNQNLRIDGKIFDYDIIQSFDKDRFLKNYPNAVAVNDSYYISGIKPDSSFCTVEDVTDRKMKSLKIEDLITDNRDYQQSEWYYDEDKQSIFLKTKAGKSDISGNSINSITFKNSKYGWKIAAKKENGKCWIQLEEIDSDEEYLQSPLDHFFEENVSIHATEKRKNEDKYDILGRRPNEYQILLGRNKHDCYPEDPYLYLKPNISDLKNQLQAIDYLKNQPFPENKPLIDLMQDRNTKKWPRFQEVSRDIEWKVLTDTDYDGCDEQREFVRVALASPDFAILNGPPGTGKTTTILELIYQLISEGKKILLAASTNAAINNILERIDDTTVFATRLGTRDKADGVEKYVLEEQCREYADITGIGAENIERLVIESANLVCGTTAGIHRLFNNRGDKYDSLSDILTKNGAPFDVMIIDECSKTTFQEFVVPARLAKKWILVGDVRQLSPFTDREQIVANLENIQGIENGNKVGFSESHQIACYDLFFIREFIRKHKNGKIILVVPDSVYDAAEKEYMSIPDGSENQQYSIYFFKKFLQGDRDYRLLYRFDAIFITSKDYQVYSNYLPHDMLVFNDKTDWLSTRNAFKYFSNEKLDESEFNSSMDGYKKTWADEVCWRLERIHWLRFAEKSSVMQKNRRQSKVKFYQKDKEYLLPRTMDIKHEVNAINSIAFPSVLESLSTSGQFLGNDITDTLSRGFNDDELGCRLVTLSYQHRMHPDISKIPRELFYTKSRGNGNYQNSDSLKDGSDLGNRTWNYLVCPDLSSHNIWINCNEHSYSYKNPRNSNEREAEIILEEVKKFRSWYDINSDTDDDGRVSKREIAILTFYRGQEKLLREKLRKLTGDINGYRRFTYGNCKIKLSTVDYFQGQEADIVFLSMVNTYRDGFLDSPNRLNVAITRARYMLVIVGKYNYYRNRSNSDLLNKFARKYEGMIDYRYDKLEETI